MPQKEFTPALGFQFLTPVYDLSVGLFTRENYWRDELLKSVNPKPGDSILDVGCGTGSLIIRLGTYEPEATLIGLDPDPQVLEIARRKIDRSGINVTLMNGFLNDELAERIGPVTKVVSSLVFHQTPVEEKANILVAMRSVLSKGGSLYIADYGLQRTRLMRILFRATVQNFDGVADTQPNADGCLPELIKSAGFHNVKETHVIATLTGSISLYQATAE